MPKIYSQQFKGECVSKANSRRLVTIKGKPRFIKSSKAIAFVKDLQAQAKRIEPLLEGDLEANIKIYYSSRRPDLDASLVLDALEGLWYKNDRQFKRLVLEKYLDKKNPRVDVFVNEISDWDESGLGTKTRF
jgi:Holliday junction resolvase RusA-like endonuclease